MIEVDVEEHLFNKYMDEVRTIEGAFAEFGVHRGNNFIRFLTKGIQQRRVTYAFDSFRGMPDPGEYDGDGYQRGKFDVGGPAALLRRIRCFPKDSYQIIEGYIPDTLSQVPEDLKFAFAYVDIDHHLTTKALLDWLVKRVPAGGIIICDDYFPDKNKLATRGIKQFIAECKVVDPIDHMGRKIVLRRM